MSSQPMGKDPPADAPPTGARSPAHRLPRAPAAAGRAAASSLGTPRPSPQGSGPVAATPPTGVGALALAAPRARLGEILVARGALTREQRDRALGRQAKLALPFGECCVRMGLIGRGTLEAALAVQFGGPSRDIAPLPAAPLLAPATRARGAHEEALRALGGRLMARWVAPGRNVLAVASPGRRDGRSHLAAHLAVALAQSGWRTLLVDADLRRASLHRVFDQPLHPGLSRVLGGAAPDGLVRRIPGVPGLGLVTAGPPPPRPSELLGRRGLARMLRQAGAYYDAVLVDTPPCGRWSDAELIAGAAGSALLVARQGHTRERAMARVADTLAGNGVQIAGTVLSTA